MHKKQIQKLREKISTLDVRELAKGTELFYGADTIISDDPDCPDSNGWSDFVKVVTPHAVELSWLILQLKDIFSDELDYMNKYGFYPALAECAKEYIESGKDEMGGLLNVVLDKAETIEL